MNRTSKLLIFAVCSLRFEAPLAAVPVPEGGYFSQGQALYNAGHYSDATDAFDMAIKKHDHEKDAQDFIDRIRKETVERIRNKALTGVSKANWQTKYYYISSIDNRIHVGISSEELFERDSVNFRPGSLDAMTQLADAISKADTTRVDIELIDEINQDTVANPELTSQQLTAIFSFLSLSARGVLPKYQ